MQSFWGGAIISCSNGSSSSDDDDESSYGTKIYSESVTFNAETPAQIVSAETLADLNIKSLTIKVINVNYSGSDSWWFSAIPGSDAWSNEAKLEWQSGEGTNSLYLATITDAAAIAAYKANGIYIAGTNSATASVSAFYIEGEAEESNDSGSENSITFDGEPKELVTKSNLENKTISSITIKLSELTYSGSESSWWISIMTDTSWSNEVKISDKGTWDNNNVTYTTTDSTEINLYKKNGIFIAALESLTGTVTVSYE